MSRGASDRKIAVDHLVVACRTLAQGRDWCEATLGVSPAPGGRHALMGTHNLLLAVSSARYPKAYLELIAIDPDAAPPARPRWFDLDDASLQAALVEPRIVHWVARCDDLDATVAELRGEGHDPGPIVGAERMTPRGLLRWRITVPADGRRPGDGAMPLWIEWGGAEHPSDVLPASGVTIESLQVGVVVPRPVAPLADRAPTANAPPPPTAGQHSRVVAPLSSPLVARLSSPRGPIVLAAPPPARLSA